MGKKTLSEELLDFLKPQSFDYDIEDSERITNNNEGDDQEINEDTDDEESKKQHYVKVAKSKLRDDGIMLKGTKYEGDTISRKSLYNDEDDHQLSEESNQEEVNQSDLGSGENSESDDSENENNNLNGKAFKSGEDSEIDLSDVLSSGDEQDDDDQNDLEKFQSAIKENKYKRDKIKNLINNQGQISMSPSIATSAQMDALKGFHILKQQSLYDSILDLRIKIQKGINTYNHFPSEKSVVEELQTEKTSKYLNKAESSLYDLLDSVMQFRLQLYKDDKLVKQDRQINAKKRSLDTYLEESHNLDATLNAYRSVVLTKWSQKIQSASGAAALNASKFKTVNQSADMQVENNLANMDRLVKRTRLNRRNIKPLGYTTPEKSKNDNNNRASVLDPSLQENSSIFDDEDFYRLLLRELVDKKVNDTSKSESIATISLTKTPKFKKNVDTKASKGRKLNFKVQEPLQNWEAPKFNKNKWDDYQIDEFFAGLFGQKINMNEDANEEPDANANDEELEEANAIANDDIQLFA